MVYIIFKKHWTKIWIDRVLFVHRYNVYVKTSEPKWVNPVSDSIGVNSLRLGGLYVFNITPFKVSITKRLKMFLLWLIELANIIDSSWWAHLFNYDHLLFNYSFSVPYGCTLWPLLFILYVFNCIDLTLLYIIFFSNYMLILPLALWYTR